MKNNRITRSLAKLLCVTLAVGAVSTPLIACNGEEEKALVLATDALDTAFNPFFYTSGPDGEIVAQTQIGMLSSNEKGDLVANWNEPCVALAYGTVTTGDKSEIQGNDYGNYKTEYYFALKNNIKFSDGTPLTKDDVLFNMYMYLDPAYTGSSTMYSVKIKGLTEYRTQTKDLDDAGGADLNFQFDADGRFDAIADWIDDDSAKWEDLKYFEYYADENTGETAKADQVIESDINQIQKFYMDSLNEMWISVISADIEKEYEKYKDKDGKLIFSEPWQVFLYANGQFTLEEHRDTNGDIDYYIPHNNYPGKSHEQKDLVNYVYNGKFMEQKEATKAYKENLLQVMYSYPVNVYFNDYLLADVKYRKFKDNMQVKNISGIKILRNQSTIPDANGDIVLKNADGNPESFDVLKITINGIDPKAIQNFGFTVAPGHYYSDKETWQKAINDNDADDEFFGVKFSDPNFMDSVRVKQLPLGAGPYRASTNRGGKATSKSQFFRSNIVYFESNPNFMLGKPKIKNLRYKVISNSQLYNAVKTGDVHYASPSMKYEEVNELEGNKGLGKAQADNLGYGYIGVSARYIPNIYIRKAIMTSFDASECIKYYGSSGASVINRPMSKTLTDYYFNADGSEPEPYYTFDESDPDGRKNKILEYLEMGNCEQRGGVMYDDKGKQLKYTFTIAGDSDDHPAHGILLKSQEILNSLGFDITVSHDSTALSKLSSGLLTVWAAAWSSSSDPDMYQVYHKDSQATSTTAWGYKYIFSSAFAEPTYNTAVGAKQYSQQDLIREMSEYIDAGREFTKEDITHRKEQYDNALNCLMDLAVEFPTYQRKVYYVWKKGVLKESTMFTGSDVTTYQSPLSRIWEVELA